jgi:hypothetical protein
MDTRPNNTIIFTIARMNPPTSGHMKLIQIMMESNIALSPEDLGHNSVYIILSHTKDNEKNPLSCSKKRQILESKGMVQHIKDQNPLLRDIDVKVLCMDDVVPEECGKHPILKQICNIRLMEQQIKGFQPSEMKLFIGADRANSYDFVISSLAKNNPPIPVVPVVVERPEGAMSATFMRGLVTSENKEEFTQAVVQNGLSQQDADDLYEELKYEMTPVLIKTKKTTSKRPKIATEEGTVSGGRRQSRRRKNNNKKPRTHKKKSKKHTYKKKRYTRK